MVALWPSRKQPEQVPLSDEFIREVDEEVRQERYEILWKRYGRYVLGAAVAIVVATAAGVFWQNYQRQQHEADSQAFIAAVSKTGQNRLDEAIAELHALSTDATTGYAVLARLREAAMLAQNGDSAAAVIVFTRVAEDSDVPEVYRDYARLMSVLHEIEGIDSDTAESRLTPLLATDNPWRFSARELAAIAAMRAARMDRARELLEANADDPEAPQGIRARAAQLLATIDA